MHPVNEAIAKADFNIGEIQPELPEDRRQLMQADAVTRGQFDDAAGGCFGLSHPPVQFAGQPENLQKLLADNLTRRCQLEEIPAPVRQPLMEFALQDSDHLADGGLRNAVEFRRPRKTLGFGQIAKTLKVPGCMTKLFSQKWNFRQWRGVHHLVRSSAFTRLWPA
jgi:hypothetical protein